MSAVLNTLLEAVQGVLQLKERPTLQSADQLLRSALGLPVYMADEESQLLGTGQLAAVALRLERCAAAYVLLACVRVLRGDVTAALAVLEDALATVGHGSALLARECVLFVCLTVRSCVSDYCWCIGVLV